MKSFFDRLPLPAKLTLIGAIPFAFLIYWSFELYREKTQKVKLFQGYLDRITQSANIAALIDALQMERKYSFDYAMMQEQQKPLLMQRLRTDSTIKILKEKHDQALSDFTTYTFLDNLQDVRTKIDSDQMDPNQVMHYYSTMIFRMNTLNAVSPGSDIYLEPVYKNLIGQKLLSEMITYLGIMRSNIYNVLHTKKYMVETLIGMIGVHDVYNTYETEFFSKASPSAVESYKHIRNNTDLKLTVEYLDTLFKRFSFDSTYDAKNWWTISDNGINELRALQKTLLSNAEAGMKSIAGKEKSKRDRTLIFMILILVFVIWIAVYTIKVITRTLTELKHAAQRISTGASAQHFSVASEDAIGSLAHSIWEIDETNKRLAEAATVIGKGNFDIPVQPRSSEDLLGNAIVQMKENLQRFTQQIEQSKEQFQQLANSMPQIVWTARPDGYLDYFNKQWYEFTGFEEGYGDQSWIPILHPDDVQYCLDTWYTAVNTGQPYQIEYRFKDRKTGGYKWFLGKALPVKDAGGKVTKWFGTCTQIQDQKMLSQELEKKVKERTKDLKEANAELERSNADLEQFAYVASHDLQEPVRKIRTFAEYIKDYNYDLLNENSKTYIEKICSSAERMQNIIRDVLDFSQLNTKSDQFELTDLNEILKSVNEDLELLINQKNATIKADKLPTIEGVPVQMNQLFYNLINNALKFSNDKRPPEITISIRSADSGTIAKIQNPDLATSYIEIDFRDNGIGFDQQYAQKIFTIFHRLSRAHSGTGIGLALCKKIVENHRGYIEAYSKRGEGSTFRVLLPQSQRD